MTHLAVVQCSHLPLAEPFIIRAVPRQFPIPCQCNEHESQHGNLTAPGYHESGNFTKPHSTT